jgi:hypothetical protein
MPTLEQIQAQIVQEFTALQDASYRQSQNILCGPKELVRAKKLLRQCRVGDQQADGLLSLCLRLCGALVSSLAPI